MSEKEPMGIDPRVKEQINNEGFEGDAAVLIGKKEDMLSMRKKMESEGNTEDLGTYIKLHKQIILPIDSEAFESEEVRKRVKESARKCFFQQYSTEIARLRYIDKDGNYCFVPIEKNKVAELKNVDMKNESVLKGMLENLGFEMVSYFSFDELDDYTNKHQYMLEENAKKTARKSFDF